MATSGVPPRLLLGPGPSNASPRVLEALGQPLLGHLDPAFLAIVDELQARLRRLFGTRNELTLPLSATGSAGMEACLANLLERGDRAVIGVAGVFGERMCEVAARIGARVTRVETEPGTALEPEAMAAAIARERPRVVAFVHAETSTGVLQPVEAIAAAARESGAYLVLDCVTSLGGLPLALDAWGVDAAYSATQKCLSCPPGLSPASFSVRAVERVRGRAAPVQSWYLDAGLLAGYFGRERVYHHTAPISAIYGLAEGLRIVEDEGIEARAARHRSAARALVDGLAAPRLRAPRGRGRAPAHAQRGAASRAGRRGRRGGAPAPAARAPRNRGRRRARQARGLDLAHRSDGRERAHGLRRAPAGGAARRAPRLTFLPRSC